MERIAHGAAGRQADLSRAAQTYLPEDWRLAIACGERLQEQARGSALFADISGFTPLSEALTRAYGQRRGSEQLSHVLNQVFDSLIVEVNRYGGSVVSFAGDAITCWFDADNSEDGVLSTALRAVTAGFAIQQAMQCFSSISIPGYPPVSLAVKVAVASGPARRFVVGDPDLQLIPVLTGVTLGRMAAAEHHTDKGEVVVDEPTMAFLADQVRVREWHDDPDSGWRFAVVEELHAKATPLPWPHPRNSMSAEDQLRPWVLPAIYRQLQAGLGEFLTELRPVVPLFLRFGGIDFKDDPEAGTKLDAFVRWVQRVADRYEGTLLVVLFGDKGSYLYMAFGAPVAHEDDARRAISAALELRTPPAQFDFITGVQIGISSGTVLAGAYGGSTRRTYGTLGDEVNLSARLMQSAQLGQVLVSPSVQQATARDFNWEALPHMPVKGKSEPVTPYCLVGARVGPTIRLQQPRYALPIVGRQHELAVAKQKLDQALEGSGQIVGITAEAGLGKSRLMAEVVSRISAQGLICYGGECQSYGTNSPYLVWRPIWQAIFGLEPGWSIEDQVRLVEERLAQIDQSLVHRLPLLGVLLNLPIPDNDLTRSFDAKLRKTSLEALLVDCIRAHAREQKVAIVLEDCHWLDPLSDDLLEAIARAIAALPVLLVLAYRPTTLETGRSPLRAVSPLPHFTEVKLIDLTPEEVERLVQQKLQKMLGAGVEVPPLLLQRVTDRAQGNPFYLEELLNYLEDRGIDPRDPRAIENLDLPTSLHSLILSRIDQVSESQKTTLKVASIIGRLFRFTWLWGVYPGLGEADRVKNDLDGLARLDITSLDQPEPDLTYMFKHIFTQEVAYESQPYAARATLHDQLGGFIEHISGDLLSQYVYLLAFHYERSENLAKRREYLRKAGEAAQAAFANTSAIDYFQRVLPLLSDEELVEVRLRLGQVLDLVGQWQEADEQYRLVLNLAEELGNVSAQGEAERSIGWLLRKRGDFTAAHEWLAKARATFEKAGDPAGVSQVYADTGEIYRLQGMYVEAEGCFQEGLKQAGLAADGQRRLAAQAQALKG
ncbi:MAG: AAA family ATPase, partial [Chloroflexi bacterium]|nr:AAA family ATPase [Chloroflexota bacterium]